MQNAKCRMEDRVRAYPSAISILHSAFRSGALTWINTTKLRLRRAACKANYTLRATKNPKAEFRSPKEIRNAKAESAKWPVRVSDLRFHSDAMANWHSR